MRRSDFNYGLPAERIAQHPLPRRTASRLLVLDGPGAARRDLSFADLPTLLRPGDLLVFNDTRVIPARLLGRKVTGGRVEVLVERVLAAHEALVHLRASKAPPVGGRVVLEEAIEAEVLERRGDLFVLRFGGSLPAAEILERVGHMPLPPYIDRPDAAVDRERYQTVYARRPGAVAAPTAGLHFDRSLLAQLSAQGIASAHVTLHVGAGTFQPVRCDDIRGHVMHSEWLEVGQDVCEAVARARAAGGRVIAVGTTTVRCLETAARGAEQGSRERDATAAGAPVPVGGMGHEGGVGIQGSARGAEQGSRERDATVAGAVEVAAREIPLAPYAGETDLFIYPGYRFRVVDAMLTNFHLPESTLLMLVCAFGGHRAVMEAYAHAVEAGYRFFSYGDAMYVARNPHPDVPDD